MSWISQKTSTTLKRALAERALLVVKNLSTQYIPQAAVAELAMKKIQPKLVITTHDPTPSASPFVALAQKNNINTLLLLHGVIDATKMGTWFQSRNIQLWGTWMTKHFPICETYTRSLKLYTTGFPYLDSILQKKESLQESSYEYLASKKPLLFTLLLSQYLPDTFIMSKFLDELFFALKNDHVSVRVVASAHREQSTVGFQELARYHHIPFTLNHHQPLETLVRNADIVLSMDTTAILWPMILKKPLFYTTPWWGSGTLPIAEYHAAYIPKNAQQLMDKLLYFIEAPDRMREYHASQERFLKEYAGVTDGNSSQKTFNLIKSLVLSL